jgi:hypothetical protein
MNVLNLQILQKTQQTDLIYQYDSIHTQIHMVWHFLNATPTYFLTIGDNSNQVVVNERFLIMLFMHTSFPCQEENNKVTYIITVNTFFS